VAPQNGVETGTQAVSRINVGELLPVDLAFGRPGVLAKCAGTAVGVISSPGVYGASLKDHVGSLLSFLRICGELRLTNSYASWALGKPERTPAAVAARAMLT
jgi:hypothetical protein